MKLRTLWASPHDCGVGPPRWCLSLARGWTSWMFGGQLHRHRYEWTLDLRLGPVDLMLEYVA